MGETINGKGYQLRGEVVHVREVETVGAKQFQKRALIIRTPDARYPQEAPIYFVQANTSKLDGIAAGDDVTVTFDLSGREWNGKWYAELRGWKVEKHGGTETELTPGPAPAASGEAKAEENLPF